ncbi:hypothetical protein [Brazilian marseillevirus]|uniref:hypothetical protein n=1 Tax=Brazilian marseillevirus TaxID=1813599 RepID=UPI000784C500|nr:hypothetical protein A3303_gp148 [Brazilian marseillevirus]AMQ10656.1 hypothetical protein [Brazilian marseillevirus]
MERFLEYQERVSAACVFPIVFPDTELLEYLREDPSGKVAHKLDNVLPCTQIKQGKSLVITRTPKKVFKDGEFVSWFAIVEERCTYDDGQISGIFYSDVFVEENGEKKKICGNKWLYSKGKRVCKL